jgi:hypothetical protein
MIQFAAPSGPFARWRLLDTRFRGYDGFVGGVGPHFCPLRFRTMGRMLIGNQKNP